ncbi:hypothetical protein ACI2K4_28805 [Micromonospora sp. NPDC050397]|uniref:hypothetical protein n=1 Tax=Micromonospora sp. NPDC050397 TaxID=3364279 RepID=UPI00384C855A
MSHQPPTSPDPHPPQLGPDGSSHRAEVGVTPAPARRTRRSAVRVGIVVLAGLVVVVGGGYVVHDRFGREDSGVAACEIIRAGGTITGKPAGSGSDLTEQEYREARDRFENSHNDRLREHGIALVDLAWRLNQMPEAERLPPQDSLGPAATHLTGLRKACADEGVPITAGTN